MQKTSYGVIFRHTPRGAQRKLELQLQGRFPNGTNVNKRLAGQGRQERSVSHSLARQLPLRFLQRKQHTAMEGRRCGPAKPKKRKARRLSLRQPVTAKHHGDQRTNITGPIDQTRLCCRQDIDQPSYYMLVSLQFNLPSQVLPCLTICLWTLTPSRPLHPADQPRLLFSLTQSAMTDLISRKFRNLPGSSPSATMDRTVPRRILSSPRSRRSSPPWLTFSPKEAMHLSFRIGGEHLSGKEECLGFPEAQYRKLSSSVSSGAPR